MTLSLLILLVMAHHYLGIPTTNLKCIYTKEKYRANYVNFKPQILKTTITNLKIINRYILHYFI